MIDIKVFRENPDSIRESQKKRGKDPKLVDVVIKWDTEWRKNKNELQKLQSQRNRIDKEIAELKKGGKSAAVKIKEMKEISKKLAVLEKKTEECRNKIDDFRLKIDNVLDKEVPFGKSEADNKEIKKWGKIPKFDFEPKSHVDLTENMRVVDVKTAAKTAGTRFYYLKNELVLLNLALQRFALDFLMKKGFVPVQPPYMLNRKAISGAVRLSEFEDSIYKIEKEDLYLIGTSEHALVSMHMDEVLNLEKPVKYAGISSCFRKEAGSHGKDTKGIFRTHRFEKVEQVIFCRPEESEKMHQELVKNSEEIFQALEIPFRIIILCSSDTGGSMAKTYDFEAWFPHAKQYRELGSASNALSYQAVKLNTRYQKKDGSREYAHMLNDTAIATERTMLAIIENNQQKDGSVKIPKVLWPYMNGLKEIKLVRKK